MDGYTMRDILQHSVKLYPKHTCLVFEDQQLTYEDFDLRTTRIAHALKKVFGVKKQEHIAVLSPNDPRYVEVFLYNLFGISLS